MFSSLCATVARNRSCWSFIVSRKGARRVARLLLPSELCPYRQAEGPLIGWLTDHQSGVATGGRVQQLEVVLVEGVLDPAVDVPVGVHAETDAEVGQPVAADIRIGRARGVRRPAAARAAVVAEVSLAIATQHAR